MQGTGPEETVRKRAPRAGQRYRRRGQRVVFAETDRHKCTATYTGAARFGVVLVQAPGSVGRRPVAQQARAGQTRVPRWRPRDRRVHQQQQQQAQTRAAQPGRAAHPQPFGAAVPAPPAATGPVRRGRRQRRGRQQLHQHQKDGQRGDVRGRVQDAPLGAAPDAGRHTAAHDPQNGEQHEEHRKGRRRVVGQGQRALQVTISLY